MLYWLQSWTKVRIRDMKIKAAILFLFFTISFGISNTQAETQRSVDVRNFDVAGVKTGMDYDQAIQAAANHFRVGTDQFEPDPFPHENIITKTVTPKYFTYKRDGISLSVYFETRIPVDKEHPLAVSMIKYEIPWSPENKARMREAALAKYGQPSNGTISVTMDWCESPNKNVGMACSDRKAVLQAGQVDVTLQDYAYTEARIKYIQSLQAVKPNF